MLNCRMSREHVPCGLEPWKCPLEDPLFTNVLRWSLLASPPAYKSITSRCGEVGKPTNKDTDTVMPSDIRLLFDDDSWMNHIFFWLTCNDERSTAYVFMSKEFCQELKDARRKWWVKLAPLDYQWQGPAKDKPDRLKMIK